VAQASGTDIGAKALTRDLPLLPRGTHSLENKTEATIRGTCPATSRRS